ncbi:MAG: hypothetical protein GYA55_14070, partial [SAR324 cluster bacterium]|nr:hypothetical protein [SAR324 cluster bacterium]
MKKETIGIVPCLFVLLVSFPAWAAQKTELLSITPNNQEGRIEVLGGTWEKINSKDVLKVTLNEEAPLHPLFT